MRWPESSPSEKPHEAYGAEKCGPFLIWQGKLYVEYRVAMDVLPNARHYQFPFSRVLYVEVPEKLKQEMHHALRPTTLRG